MLGTFTSLANIAASILRSKATAVILGPYGVGLAAEVQQLVNLALVPASSFTGPAFTAALAESTGDRNAATPSAVAGAALSWAIASTVLLGGFAVAFTPWLFPARSLEPPFHLVALAALASVGTVALGVPTGALVNRGLLRHSTRIQIASSLFGAGLACGLTWWLGLEGLFLALALSPLLAAPWVFHTARAALPDVLQGLRLSLDRGYLRRALSVGLVSIVAAASLQAALYSIRWVLELAGGPELNGQFQAAWAIGSAYLGLVLSAIGSFAFPRFASAASAVELRKEILEAAHFVLRLAPPFALLALAFRQVGVELLYSHRFDVAVDILAWQLAGDVAKALSWVLVGPLLYRGHLRGYLVTELVAASLLAISTALLVPAFGPVGVGQAYLLTYVVYLPVTWLALRKSTQVSAGAGPLLWGLAITFCLALFAALPQGLASRLFALGVAGLWFWRIGLIEKVIGRARRVLGNG